MKTSEFIDYLKSLMEKHGDVEIFKTEYNGDLIPAHVPVATNKMDDFYGHRKEWLDFHPKGQKGDLIIKI